MSLATPPNSLPSPRSRDTGPRCSVRNVWEMSRSGRLTHHCSRAASTASSTTANTTSRKSRWRLDSISSRIVSESFCTRSRATGRPSQPGSGWVKTTLPWAGSLASGPPAAAGSRSTLLSESRERSRAVSASQSRPAKKNPCEGVCR